MELNLAGELSLAGDSPSDMSEAQDNNPYAAPQATEEPPVRPAEPYREGKFIVAPPKGSLPARCAICNRSATHPRKLAAGWVSVHGYSNVSVTWFACDRHHERLARVALLRPAAFLSLISLAIFLGLVSRNPLAFLFMLLIVMAAYAWICFQLNHWAGEPLTIESARPKEVRIKGAGEGFLQSLAQAPTTGG